MVNDDRLHHVLLLLGIWRRGRRPGEQVAGLFAHHDLTAGRREDRQQTDFELRSANRIPRNPDAVRSAEFGGTEMFAELLAGEHKLAVRLSAVLFGRRVVVAVHDQLSLDGNGLVLLIIKIEPAAEAAGRGFARCVVHGRRPERDDAGGSLKRQFLVRLGRWVEQLLEAAGHRPAFGPARVGMCSHQSTDEYEQRNLKRDLHGSRP